MADECYSSFAGGNDQSKNNQFAYAFTENNARLHKIGLFQDKAPVAPWQWRKNKIARKLLNCSFYSGEKLLARMSRKLRHKKPAERWLYINFFLLFILKSS